MKIHIIERYAHDSEELEKTINANVAAGWTLLGPVQICQSHGGLYVYLVTMIYHEPAEKL